MASEVENPLSVVVLAAGQGTRMKSDLPKVLHTLGDKPLLEHVILTAKQLGAAATHVVYGHGVERVKQALTHVEVNWVLQDPHADEGDSRFVTPEAPVPGTIASLFAARE